MEGSLNRSCCILFTCRILERLHYVFPFHFGIKLAHFWTGFWNPVLDSWFIYEGVELRPRKRVSRKLSPSTIRRLNLRTITPHLPIPFRYQTCSFVWPVFGTLYWIYDLSMKEWSYSIAEESPESSRQVLFGGQISEWSHRLFPFYFRTKLAHFLTGFWKPVLYS